MGGESFFMSYLAIKSLKVNLLALPSVRNQLQSEENHRVPFLSPFPKGIRRTPKQFHCFLLGKC